METFPQQFGMAMGELVVRYRETWYPLAAVLHLAFLTVFALVAARGNRFRRLFAVFFVIDYAWVFANVGVVFTIRIFRAVGPLGLAFYGATPLLLLLILWRWLEETRNPANDFDLRNTPVWRWAVALPFLLWGFWYPPYEWGVGLNFHPKELLFGAFGLMGCPTTLVPLAVLFLRFPSVNLRLYTALIVYAVMVGFAMVMLRYIPDIPFFAMGAVALADTAVHGVRVRRARAGTKTD